MKKIILTTLLSTLLTTSLIIATEVETKPKIDYMAEIMKLDKQEKQLDKELESAKKVNTKLDELKSVLTKKKLQDKN